MDHEIIGGCACGAIRYSASAKPVASFNCHCRVCQQVTGTAYLSGLFVPATSFTLTAGTPTYYTVRGDSGGNINRGFCPTCGSHVCVTYESMSRFVGIAAGTLDDPSWHKPTMDIYTAMAQPWDFMNPELTKFPGSARK